MKTNFNTGLISLTSILILGFILVSTMSTHKKIDKIKNEYIERNESLIKDSIKMHQWYENWELTYQEKINLK